MDTVFLMVDIAVVGTVGALLLWRLGAMDEAGSVEAAKVFSPALVLQRLAAVDEKQMNSPRSRGAASERIAPRPITAPAFTQLDARPILRHRAPTHMRPRSPRRVAMTNASSAWR